MKKLSVLICTLALAALLAGCSQQTNTADPIGIDAAKTLALEDAGINTADASFTTAGLDRRGDLEYYDVEFTAGGQEYEYEIDALTGVIIERGGAAGQGGTAQTDDAGTTQSGQTSTAPSGQTGTTQSGTVIGEAAAKQAALDLSLIHIFNLQGQVNCPCTKVLTFAARITLRAGAHSAPSLSPCDHARIPASHIRGRYMKKQPAFKCQAAMHLFLIAGWLTYRVCLPLALMFCLVSLILSILLIKEELQIRRRPRS